MEGVPFIQVADLRKTYLQGESPVAILNGLDLVINAGEILVILGVSGTGKSTLLNILGGIDRPDSGSVQVEGQELTALSDRQLALYRREKVGFVFQFYNLLPSLTAVENVLSGVEARGAVGRSDHERARALLAAVGLVGKEEKLPQQLSGGEQQRVAIARALVKSPPLLLADEPTGNLDHATGERVLKLLIEQARQTTATLIIVTHNLALTQFADRTLVLYNGRVTVSQEAV